MSPSFSYAFTIRKTGMNFAIELANVKIRISVRLPDTIHYFEDFIIERDCKGWDIRIDDTDISMLPLICPSGNLDPFSEAYLLMPKVSCYMLQFECSLIHGVSIVWHGHSWLITAPSGTGKTTQLRHWQDLWPDEFELINGDKSVMALHGDGSFWLHPSPWTGKEKENGTASAPLAGIIVLEQANFNKVRRLLPKDSVLRIYQQFLILGDDSAEVQMVGRLESKLIQTTPVWLMENLGDKDSAVLMHQTMEDYEVSRNEKI